MSDCCEHYLARAKKTAENQYASLRSAIGTVVQRQGWKVNQVSFITGARSVDKQDFQKNLKFFGVPEASISRGIEERELPLRAHELCCSNELVHQNPLFYFSITGEHNRQIVTPEIHNRIIIISGKE
jgi:hypothetical protein